MKSTKRIEPSKFLKIKREDDLLVEKTKADTLKTQINHTDKEIDAMVYDLYSLTQEEIEIVENS